jgi:hypothetical protein
LSRIGINGFLAGVGGLTEMQVQRLLDMKEFVEISHE